jgi:signal peptidase I
VIGSREDGLNVDLSEWLAIFGLAQPLGRELLQLTLTSLTYYFIELSYMFEKFGRKSKKNRPANVWRETAQTLGLSLLIAFGFRTTVAQSFYLPPSGSMEPTLQNYDRLTIDKLSYRFRSPQRSDIIVFTPPTSAAIACGLSTEKQQDAFIKRIIAVPGDRVEIKAGITYLNNRQLNEPYIKQKPEYTLPLTTVPRDSYLALGDNRNNSCDGHVWGFVPRDNIIGKATLRIWPLDHFGGLDTPH